MRKVLLITYYFDPANSVGTPRMVSWAHEFWKYGLHTTIITRHWKGGEANWNDFLVEDKREIQTIKKEFSLLYYLPYFNSKPPIVGKSRFFSKMYHLIQFLQGHFNPEINAYQAFKQFCRNLLKNEKFDLILVSAPPHNLVRLASELGGEFNTPFAVDFRDIWNNQLTFNDADNRNLRQRFMNATEETYIKRWLKNCRLVTSVSPALIEVIERHYTGKTAVITNGFEESYFKDIRLLKPSTEFFTFSSIGTIYPMQDLSVLINGLKLFYPYIQKADDFRLFFIGIKAVPEVATRLEHELEMFRPTLTNRLSRKEAFSYYGISHVLYKSAWATHRGMYSAKIFEYVGACRNILIAPNDKDVVEKLITETGLGHIADTAEEFAEVLKKLYDEWKLTGAVEVHARMDKVDAYSRERQAGLLAEHIHSV